MSNFDDFEKIIEKSKFIKKIKLFILSIKKKKFFFFLFKIVLEIKLDNLKHKNLTVINPNQNSEPNKFKRIMTQHVTVK
jgi:hypothetical protein